MSDTTARWKPSVLLAYPATTIGAVLCLIVVAGALLAPWLSVWPGLAILLLVLGLNMVGDGLRDATDPRLRGET